MADISHLLRTESRLAGAMRWKFNQWLRHNLWLAEKLGLKYTIIDGFGTPGDTLLTAIVYRHLKQRHPRLRINCITPNPDLVAHDPNLAVINQAETFCAYRFWYLEITGSRDGTKNVLTGTFKQFGIHSYDYRARVFVTPEEIRQGAQRLEGLTKPVISINILSRDPIKNWPLTRWQELTNRLARDCALVQLGLDDEPYVDGVLRMAGRLSKRESMAVLANCDLHIGPDSFLMHAANGVDVPAVIIFGGSRTPVNLGYAQNTNLFTALECSSCWLNSLAGEVCRYHHLCMDKITVEQVMEAVKALVMTKPFSTWKK